MSRCPDCGEEFSEVQNFCRNCGNDLEDIPTAEPTDPPSTTIESNPHIADEHGDYVTRENVEKIQDILDDGEKVHYLTRGSTVDVQGSSAGHSIFGDDRSRKTGTRGWVRTAITDRRIVVKVPQWLGNDERSLPYQNITSVDL